MRRVLPLLFIGTSLLAQTPDVGEIMRRVSENFDRAQAARAAWVYDQDIFVRPQAGQRETGARRKPPIYRCAD